MTGEVTSADDLDWRALNVEHTTIGRRLTALEGLSEPVRAVIGFAIDVMAEHADRIAGAPVAEAHRG
jgi:hypothetical protein